MLELRDDGVISLSTGTANPVLFKNSQQIWNFTEKIVSDEEEVSSSFQCSIP